MRSFFLAALAAVLASTASAQPQAFPPDPLSAPVAEPAADPRAWWADPERRTEDRHDPLGVRRWSGRDRPVSVERAPDASVYRLWGLSPLQSQPVRRGDQVLEVWVRPTGNRPQGVVRLTVRGDGRVFAQARAGYTCCRPDISRRVDVDVELPRASRDGLLALRQDPLWAQPENVEAREEGAVAGVCVDGISYDLYLAVEGRALHRRRSCDDAEVGSAAGVLETAFAAVRGQEPRFDAALPQNGNFEAQRAYLAEFTARGGRLTPAESGGGDATPLAAQADVRTDQQAATEAITAADFAWAARAGEPGALAEVMDPEGLVFRPGADPITPATASGWAGRLAWGPVAAQASEDGGFGASWGRWNFTPADPTTTPIGGRYLTVWRRDEEGRWRGLMTLNDGAVWVGGAGVEPAAQAPNPPASR